MLLIFSFAALNSKAQMLDNKNGDAFTDKPFFNEAFIQKNQVKELKGNFIYKKKGDVMRPTSYYYVYHFDTLGRLDFTYETKQDDGTKDSTKIFFYYDSLQRIRETYQTNSNGFLVKSYTFDHANFKNSELVSQLYYDSIEEVPRSTILQEETIVNQYFDKQIQSTYYNNYHLPYKKITQQFNELGYLLESEDFFLMNSSRLTTKYTYNEHGFLAQKTTYMDTLSIPVQEEKYLYDEFGNLTLKSIYKNGIHQTDIEFLYNQKSALLATIIIREVATNFMMIIRFTDISFYEVSDTTDMRMNDGEEEQIEIE